MYGFRDLRAMKVCNASSAFLFLAWTSGVDGFVGRLSLRLASAVVSPPLACIFLGCHRQIYYDLEGCMIWKVERGIGLAGSATKSVLFARREAFSSIFD